MRILKIDATTDEYDPRRAHVSDVSLSECMIPMINLYLNCWAPTSGGERHDYLLDVYPVA